MESIGEVPYFATESFAELVRGATPQSQWRHAAPWCRGAESSEPSVDPDPDSAASLVVAAWRAISDSAER